MLKLDINPDDILSQVTQAKEEAKKDIIQAVEKLSMMTYGYIVADAEKLPDQVGRAYRKALHQPEPVNADSDASVWVISLDESAMWIEEHLPEKIDMKPNLLKGKKYVRIPFKYASKGGNAPRSAVSEGLLMEIKQVLKDKHGKDDSFLLKTEKDGKKAKTGKLHEFDMSGEGRFMSWKKRKEGETHPLKRLSIFQTRDKSSGRIKRDVLVFRTVSSGDASSGKWMHPGLNKQLMDAAVKRAEQEWESIIKPELERKWAGK